MCGPVGARANVSDGCAPTVSVSQSGFRSHLSSPFSCSQTEEVSVETEEEAGSQETRWITAGPEADRKELFHVCRSFGVDGEPLHKAYWRLLICLKIPFDHRLKHVTPSLCSDKKKGTLKRMPYQHLLLLVIFSTSNCKKVRIFSP